MHGRSSDDLIGEVLGKWWEIDWEVSVRTAEATLLQPLADNAVKSSCVCS